jgi:hypothetical protein
MSRQPILYIERMRDWNFGAFCTPTCASCIAIGETILECAKAGIRALRDRPARDTSREMIPWRGAKSCAPDSRTAG